MNHIKQHYIKYLIGLAILLIFILGLMARPSLDKAVRFVQEKTTNKVSYVQSDYPLEDSADVKRQKEIANEPRVKEAIKSFIESIDKARIAEQASRTAVKATQDMALSKGHADGLMSELLIPTSEDIGDKVAIENANKLMATSSKK